MLIERALAWVYHYLALMKLRGNRPMTPWSTPGSESSDREFNTLAEERDGTHRTGMYLPYQYIFFTYSR